MRALPDDVAHLHDHQHEHEDECPHQDEDGQEGVGIVAEGGEDASRGAHADEQLEVLHHNAEFAVEVGGVPQREDPHEDVDRGDQAHLQPGARVGQGGHDGDEDLAEQLRREPSEGMPWVQVKGVHVQGGRFPGSSQPPGVLRLPELVLKQRRTWDIVRIPTDGRNGKQRVHEGRQQDCQRNDQLQVGPFPAMDGRRHVNHRWIPQAMEGFRGHLHDRNNKQRRGQLHEAVDPAPYNGQRLHHKVSRTCSVLFASEALPIGTFGDHVVHELAEAEERYSDERRNNSHGDHHLRPEHELLADREHTLYVEHGDLVDELGLLMHPGLPRDGGAEGEGEHLRGRGA
mmetsp:Transcript_125582/g.351694  ORF Transcript_125582/g.351694 Transcript_125582/m.351694 type:complete len:343 (+) Transcript_125582:272-1300(+)